jgi:hypothetical protein
MMKLYWIHYASVAAGQDRRFSVLEAKENGARVVISPAGRLETPGVVVEWLVRCGADPDESCRRVSAAIRDGVSHVTVAEGRPIREVPPPI